MEKFKSFLHKYRHCLLMLLVGIFIAIFDLITKAVTDGKTAEVIDGFVSVYSSHNTGAAWSMLNQHTWLLIILSVIFIGIILFANYNFKNKNFLYSLAMGLILGGALCNLFDRVVFGYVRDFISLEFMDFPIFNIADCAITVGVILIVIFFIILAVRENKQGNAEKINAINNYTQNVELNKSNENEKDLSNLNANDATISKEVIEEKPEKTAVTKKSKLLNANSNKTSSTSKKIASKGKKDATNTASKQRKASSSKSKKTDNTEAK